MAYSPSSIILLPDFAKPMTTSAELLSELDRVDRRTRLLIEDLSDEQLAVPYERGINPPIWELGHSAFFFEYFLLRGHYGCDPISPDLDDMWDSFVIPHRERWTPGVVPNKATTLAYYDQVLTETRSKLDRTDLSDEELYLGQYVIAHQCMHIESLVWCRQTTGWHSPSFLGEDATDYHLAPPGAGDAEIPGGAYFIGVPKPEPGRKSENFSFDNERPGFEIELGSFQISKTLVSQGEFRDFVEDDGYSRNDLWSFGGSYWLRQCNRNAPAYWENRDGAWMIRRFADWLPFEPDCPVLHVSFWEAEAFCNWANRRLPTEFEWEAAARGPEARKFPNHLPPSSASSDFDCRFAGKAPVHAFPESASASGCLQMLGTAWEWTNSEYLPFDGFSTDMYAYMSVLQFGTHQTCKGGSTATASSLIRNSYRQPIHPDRYDLFTGFRTCAKEPS